jgi:hypothetical protein
LEATRESLVDAITAANQRRDLNRGYGAVRRAFNIGADAIADGLGGDDYLLQGAQRVERQNPGIYDPETMKRIERHLAKIEANIGDQKKQIDSKLTMRLE